MSCWLDGVMWGTRLAASVLCVSLFVACTTAPPREELLLKEATVEELTALLVQREAALHSLKGLFSAKVRGGIIPIATRVEGALYYQRPHAMRLRGFTAIGSELFEFLQADDQYILRLPTMGRVLSGSRSDTSEMGKLARPFQLSVWAMDGVLGTGRLAADETARLTEEGSLYRLEVSGPTENGTAAARRRLWFDRQNLLVVKEERLTVSGEVDASIQYEDFRTVGDLAVEPAPTKLVRPFKISLEDGQGKGSVLVTFHELIPNQPIKPSELGRG